MGKHGGTEKAKQIANHKGERKSASDPGAVSHPRYICTRPEAVPEPLAHQNSDNRLKNKKNPQDNPKRMWR